MFNRSIEKYNVVISNRLIVFKHDTDNMNLYYKAMKLPF